MDGEEVPSMSDRSNATSAIVLTMAGAGAILFARAAAQRARHFDYAGKTALITGGSRGLGLLLARHLAEAGARIVICARDEEELQQARQDLERRGTEVLTVACDVSDNGDVQDLVSEAKRRFGQIDVLINNASIISVGPLDSMTLEDFEEAMAINYWSMVYTTLAVLPEMRKRGSGRIVNVTSIGGRLSVPHLLPYCTAKFAAVGFSRGLRSEVYKDGVVVTTVVPGLMRTGSPRNADFKGRHREEYAWFSISDSMPGISIDADKAARQILNAARRGDVELTLTLPAKMAVSLDALFPEITGGLLALANFALPRPGGIGTESAKGHESESQLAPSVLTTLSDKAAERNNQFQD
jgi:NAD(P)-dependent dehydrogenase (short-subunit alcohol dehydrogenase family)